ncbi:MAG: alanine racemase, partial [Proteobacteria bacterium]|nr:alanine racemase [Burkholderiales bacterium]
LEGYFCARDLADCARAGITPVLHDAAQIDMLEAARLDRPIDCFVKMNSGMNRLGFAPHAFTAAVERVRALRSVASVTLMTHFACADEVEGVAAQMETFDAQVRAIDQASLPRAPLPRSLANSASLLRFPATHAQWVRPGIMLYGVSPFADQSASDLGLQAAMRLESSLIAIQRLRAGECVGYGGSFEAVQAMRIGIVACGYADGYPRHAPTGTPVLVDGARTRTVGRVSMDMLAVDLSPVPQADIGTPVTLWGGALPVEEVAAAAGTIGYELLCAVAPRVPMRELGDPPVALSMATAVSPSPSVD